MDKIISALLLTCFLISPNTSTFAQGSETGYVISCNFEDLPNGSIVVLTTQKGDTVQTEKSIGNTVTFKGILNPQGQFLFIKFDLSLTDKSTEAIFVKNSQIYVSGSLNKRAVDVKGSMEQEEYKKLQSLQRKYAIILGKNDQELMAYYNSVPKDSISGQPLQASAKSKIDSFYKVEATAQKQAEDEFIAWTTENPSSYLAPYILKALLNKNNVSSIRVSFANLTDSVKEGHYGKLFARELKYADTWTNIQHKMPFPNLEITDKQGKTKKIHEIVKNHTVTLIDCWASWCVPCRNQIPKLKLLYDKYKDSGFNIIAISSDRKMSDWLKALQEENTMWDNYIEKKDAPFAEICGIGSIPTYILLGKNGELLAFHTGMSMTGSLGENISGDNLELVIKQNLGVK